MSAETKRPTRPECPVCHGAGYLAESAGTKRNERVQFMKGVINKLKVEGYTVREIMVMLGYRSPNTVQYYLRKETR